MQISQRVLKLSLGGDMGFPRLATAGKYRFSSLASNPTSSRQQPVSSHSCARARPIKASASVHVGMLFQTIRKMSTTLLQPIVLSGPSGSGKSTLVKKLMGEYKDCFAFSVSHTTRKPRPGESDGKDYHFVSREALEAAIANGEFVEHAQFSGNMYGTSKQAVRTVMETGRLCILDIDMQGVKNLKQTDLNPKYIFIKPPSYETLEARLRGRGTESEESLQKRLDTAKAELLYAEEKGAYDHIVVNDNLDIAYEKLKGILITDIDVVLKRQNKSV